VFARAADGYVFDGWSGFPDADAAGKNNPATINVTEDGMTITANFIPGSGGAPVAPPSLTYRLTVNTEPANGGNVELNPPGGTYGVGTPVTVTAVPNTGDGYVFDRWSGAETSDNPIVTITMSGDNTLTANFMKQTVTPPDTTPVTPPPPPPTPTIFTITFDANYPGGSVSPPSAATKADSTLSITLPTLTRSGYNFDGWFTADNNEVTAGTKFTANATIYARWSQQVPGTPPAVVGSNNCTGAGSCKSVSIGGQTWMAENLNINTANSWCYKNSSDSCAKYGRLYTWAAARTACPTGWHLPSRAEWDGLFDYAASSPKQPNNFTGTFWPGAGTTLKSTSGWNSGGNGEDNYGFSALPGGRRFSNSTFDYVGNYGDWWAAESVESVSGNAYIRSMSYESDDVAEFNTDKSEGVSVRCVAD